MLLDKNSAYEWVLFVQKSTTTLIHRQSRHPVLQRPRQIQTQEIPNGNPYLPLLRRLRGLYPRNIRRRPRHVRLDLRHLIRSGRLLNLLLPWHPRKPVKEQGRNDVKDDEGPHDPEIPPAVFIMAAQLRQKHIRVAHGAEFALVHCIWVG